MSRFRFSMILLTIFGLTSFSLKTNAAHLSSLVWKGTLNELRAAISRQELKPGHEVIVQGRLAAKQYQPSQPHGRYVYYGTWQVALVNPSDSRPVGLDAKDHININYRVRSTWQRLVNRVEYALKHPAPAIDASLSRLLRNTKGARATMLPREYVQAGFPQMLVNGEGPLVEIRGRVAPAIINRGGFDKKRGYTMDAILPALEFSNKDLKIIAP